MKFLGHHEKLDKGGPLPILNPATSPSVAMAQLVGGWSGCPQKFFFLKFDPQARKFPFAPVLSL